MALVLRSGETEHSMEDSMVRRWIKEKKAKIVPNVFYHEIRTLEIVRTVKDYRNALNAYIAMDEE